MANKEINQAFSEAEKYEAEPPRALARELPEPDEYPIESLGSVLAPTARSIQALVGLPIAIAAQSILGASNLAVQGHADVVLPTGSPRPVSLYLLTVARSGERKSEADRLACEAITQKEKALHERFRIEEDTWRNKQEAWKTLRSRATKKARDVEETLETREAMLAKVGPEPEPPLAPILRAPDPTFEGLVKLLRGGQPSMGVFSDEGGQFIGGYGMAPEQRLKTAAAMSKFWDGDPITRVRAGDGAYSLFGRRVCLHLLTQPNVAPAMLANKDLIDQGIVSRFLPCQPTSTMGSRYWQEPNPEDRQQLKRFASGLGWSLESPLPLAEHARNELVPRELPLSAEASDLWVGFVDHIEGMIGENGLLYPVCGLANKAPEHAARLAATTSLVEDLTISEITGGTMESGIRLMEFYLSEALRLHEAAQVPPELQLAQRVLRWLHDRGLPTVSLPDIYQRGPSCIRDAKMARAIVDVLEDHGWLQRIEGGTCIEGVRRREAWRIVEPT